jgi:hypothetical protein
MLGTTDYDLQVVANATTALLDTRTVVHVTAAKFKPLILSMSTDQATPLYPQKLALYFVDKWRSSGDIVRSRTKGHGVCFLFVYFLCRASPCPMLRTFSLS